MRHRQRRPEGAVPRRREVVPGAGGWGAGAGVRSALTWILASGSWVSSARRSRVAMSG